MSLADRETKVEDIALTLETVTQEVQVTERAESLATENSAAETTANNHAKGRHQQLFVHFRSRR